MSNQGLSGAWNFRDVAELTGVRSGRLFRSSELSGLDDAGRKMLGSLGIAHVADLRSPREVERRGADAVPNEVSVHLLPFPDLATATAEAPHESSWRAMMTEQPAGDDPNSIGDAAIQFMTGEYAKFPTLAGAQFAVRQLISLLGDNQTVIAHCFAGKDRTGFAVAIVLEAIGISREAILADFLRSNDAVPQLREAILESIRTRAGETPEVITFAEARLTDEVLGVREEYLATARQVMDDEYGSLAGYLTAAGVTANDVARVRTALLGP